MTGFVSRAAPLALVSLASLTLALPVLADSVQVKDGAFTARVSAKSESRITILGEKVAKIHLLNDNSGPKAIAEADQSTGDVYVAFDGDAAGKSFSLFLTTTSNHTYQADLQVQNIAAQTVVVHPDPSVRTVTPDSPENAPPELSNLDHREDYSEVLTAFVRVMFDDISPEGGFRTQVNDHPKRAGDFEVQQIYAYQVPGLKGTVLSVRNVSKEPQHLSAHTFSLPGVLASAVSHELVQPGDLARVYIVEAGQ